MSAGITHFSKAITRTPSDSATAGLRAADRGIPDITQMKADHAAYCDSLRATGASVTILPASDDFPDAQFVEDTALCLANGIIFMAPGAPSRLGEVALMQAAIADLFPATATIMPPAHIEGGDILVTAHEILVGTSSRTNEAGIAALRDIVTPWGYQVRQVQTPPGVLHFKTDCSLIDDTVILTTKRLAEAGCFDDYTKIFTADGEEEAANTIRFNDVVIMSAGFPQTHSRIEAAGYKVVTINNSECAKIDGGMSCLSLRIA